MTTSNSKVTTLAGFAGFHLVTNLFTLLLKVVYCKIIHFKEIKIAATTPHPPTRIPFGQLKYCHRRLSLVTVTVLTAISVLTRQKAF